MITLRPVTSENFDALLALKVKDWQTKYVASNLYSLAEAYLALSSGETFLQPFTIYHHKQLIGFTMYQYDQLENSPEDAHPVYFIWRVFIDKKYQGRGLGKKAMESLLAHIRTFPQGKADAVYVSYMPDNEASKQLFASLGFKETGEMDDDEAIARYTIE